MISTFCQAIRLSVKSDEAKSDFPVLFVVRMVKGVRSWTVPLITSDGYASLIVCTSCFPQCIGLKHLSQFSISYVNLIIDNFYPQKH